MLQKIAQLINCQDKKLLLKIEQSTVIFDGLDQSKSYQIAFTYLGFYVLGAIHIKERRAIWEKVNKEKLLALNFISLAEIEEINKALESDYSYPKSYPQKWIDSQHQRGL